MAVDRKKDGWDKKGNVKEKIRLRAEEGDNVIPSLFDDILLQRYFPVLSLTYVASVVGMTASRGGANFLHGLFSDPVPYRMALWIGVWVSMPAILWIFLRLNIDFARYADTWYKWTAGLMTFTLLFSFILFPAGAFGNAVRLFMVGSVPIFIVQYFLFVKGGFPKKAAWPIMGLGLGFFIVGFLV